MIGTGREIKQEIALAQLLSFCIVNWNNYLFSNNVVDYVIDWVYSHLVALELISSMILVMQPMITLSDGTKQGKSRYHLGIKDDIIIMRKVDEVIHGVS